MSSPIPLLVPRNRNFWCKFLRKLRGIMPNNLFRNLCYDALARWFVIFFLLIPSLAWAGAKQIVTVRLRRFNADVTKGGFGSEHVNRYLDLSKTALVILDVWADTDHK